MIRPQTIGEAFVAAAAGPAGIWHLDERGDGRFVPYAELLAAARGVAHALHAAGLGRGTRVGIAIGVSEAFARTFFGAILAGCTVTPLAEANVLRDATGFVDQLSASLESAQVDVLIADDRTASFRTDLRLPVMQADSLRYPGEAGLPDLPSSLDDPVLVQLTSGSTGAPKGIVLTHRSVDANVRGIIRALDATPADIGVSWLPLHHDMGLVGMLLAPMYLGGSTVLLPTLAFVKRPTLWLKTIAKFRGTVSFAPSSAYALAARRIRPSDCDQLDLSSWRVAGCGAEPIDPAALDAFADAVERCGFRRTAFTACYGLAEHVVAACIPPPGRGLVVDVVSGAAIASQGLAVPCAATDPDARRIVSCGLPLDGHAMAVVDEAGRRVAERRIGEIALRGPSVMRGHLRAGGGVEPMTDGLLRTGDLGYVADGELYVCGRAKETIVLGGQNFDPYDIEHTVSAVAPLRGAPVVAFGTSPFRTAERVVVAIEAPAGAADVPDLVRRAVMSRWRVAVHEVLVVRPRTLPATTSGKPRRLLLRDRYERGELAHAIRYRG